MTHSRQSYSGSAVATTLTSGIGPTTLTIPVAATLNFPDTAVGPFVATLDRGNGSLQEKVKIVSYTSTTLRVATGGRGWDGTTAQDHTVGAPVAHTNSAEKLTELDAFMCSNGTVTPHASAVGDTASDGTSTAPAAADHKHAREAFGVGQSSILAFGESHSDGTQTSLARSDHVHGMPAAPTTIPVGGIITWGSTTAPATSNWLFLHGQTISGGAATYPNLATAYPAWVSSGNLVLPDSRTKYGMGAGGAHAAGATGGSLSVTLVSANLPTTAVSVTDAGHTHTITDGGHHHLTYTANTSFQAMYTDPTPAATRLNKTATDHGHGTYVTWNPANVDQNATTGITINSHVTGITAKVGQSSPTPVTVTPPYLALNKIVRAQ